MKQTLDCRIDTTKLIQLVIFKWLKTKGYPLDPILPLGYYIELLIDFSRNLHTEEIASGVFNHLLTNNESIVGWEGEELIEILKYEAVEAIKKRLAKSALF